MPSPLRVKTNVEIEGTVDMTGALLTGEDFFRLPGGAGRPMGGVVPATGESNGWTGLILTKAGGTQGIGFSISFPSRWTTANMSWGFVPLAAGAARNVRWRARIRLVNALLNPDFSDALITEPVDVETLATQTVRPQFALDHLFNTPLGFAVHNAGSLFGEVAHISLERLAGDALDTYAGDVMLTNFSVNRAT